MRALGEPNLDRLLARDGFVQLPRSLLDTEEAKELRDCFVDLFPGERAGFHSDLVVSDRDYRRAASDVISEALDHRASEVFEGYEPFLRSFLCKWPGPESGLYLHRDWMYVDEREGASTFVLWVALQDIAGHNGQFRALRGSHRLDNQLRGTDLVAPWLRHEEAIERRLVSIPVRTGLGLVFNNALVHGSFPNNTDEPRVAVAIGMRPAGIKLVHFRRRSEDQAERYDIDESFLLEHTPHQLMEAPPNLRVCETLAATDADLSESELCDALDTSPMARIDRVRRSVVDPFHSAAGRSRSAASQIVLLGQRLCAGASQALHATGDALVGCAERARTGLGALRSRRRWHQPVSTAREVAAGIPSKAATTLLELNEAVQERWAPGRSAVWNTSEFGWTGQIEQNWLAIRSEVDSLLEGPTEIPHIEDVTGGIPQGNEGPWRSFVLMHQGRWIDWNCERCPRTTALVKPIPGLTMAGFSVLEPGTHITTHRGPNKGALRYQLGIVVPTPEGACRIRVGDQLIYWREGEGVMFDFTVPHEAWNDSDSLRVLLMLEVLAPLPLHLDVPNRLAQRAMGFFPTTRGIDRRLARLEPTLVKSEATGTSTGRVNDESSAGPPSPRPARR